MSIFTAPACALESPTRLTVSAATSAAAPSVIQVRAQNIMPESVRIIVVDAIKKFSDKLSDGALVSIDHNKARARLLPLRR